MRRSEIEEQNQLLLRQQRQFRMAADVVTDALMDFPDVRAIAVIGSVAQKLWKEIPRFSEFRRARIEVWHECSDLDLAVWLDSQDCLDELRRALAQSLTTAFKAGKGVSVPSNRVDVFLFEPGSDRYLGRLCQGQARLSRSRLRDDPFQQGRRRLQALRRYRRLSGGHHALRTRQGTATFGPRPAVSR
jgi:hypothetical protein